MFIFNAKMIFAIIFMALLFIDSAHAKHGKLRGETKNITLSIMDDDGNNNNKGTITTPEDSCAIFTNITAYEICVTYCKAKQCADDIENGNSTITAINKSAKKKKKTGKGKSPGKKENQSCTDLKDTFVNMTGWIAFPCEFD